MEPKEFLAFLARLEKLKCNTRHSWTSSGRHESVAEHSWRLAMLALLLRDALPEVDMAEEEEISYNESSSKNQIHEVFTENNMSETDNMTGWRKYEDNKDDDATRGFGFGFGSDGKEDGETEEETILLIQPPQIIGKLIRCATGEEFILDEGMNIVGKSKIRADICIRNNPAIGNVHCEISREDNEFYLEDNRSLNGTDLENTKLDPEVRTLLETEDRIRLADEEFIFRTEQGEEKIL